MPKKHPSSYEELRDVWYDKLSKDDFEDIESNEEFLKTWHSFKFASPESKRYQFENAEYFRLAELFLQEHQFKSSLEKTIWSYHTNGLTIREIAAILEKAKVKKSKKDKVNYIIKRLVKIMKDLYL